MENSGLETSLMKEVEICHLLVLTNSRLCLSVGIKSVVPVIGLLVGILN